MRAQNGNHDDERLSEQPKNDWHCCLYVRSQLHASVGRHVETKSSMQPAEKPNDQDERNRNADQP
jgi:hypothetical protein